MSDRSTAVVVGGASGIGAEVVRVMTHLDHTVVVADRDLDAAARLVDELGDPAHRAEYVDVTDENSVADLFESSAQRHERLQVLVNCAGITALGLLTEMPAAAFRRVVDVCLTGAFLVIQQAGRHLVEGGTVISLSSLNARQPGVGLGAYCAAKAGLSMLTQVAALELAPRIRVNAVAPGLIRTPLTSGALDVPGVEDEYVENVPLGRPGTAAEVADAVRYLVEARWVTGEVLDLNGGAHLMRYPNLHAHFTKAVGR